jgi:hypothetical protein
MLCNRCTTIRPSLSTNNVVFNDVMESNGAMNTLFGSTVRRRLSVKNMALAQPLLCGIAKHRAMASQHSRSTNKRGGAALGTRRATHSRASAQYEQQRERELSNWNAFPSKYNGISNDAAPCTPTINDSTVDNAENDNNDRVVDAENDNDSSDCNVRCCSLHDRRLLVASTPVQKLPLSSTAATACRKLWSGTTSF